jgi:hypothetical protein
MAGPFGPSSAPFERLGEMLINKVAPQSLGDSGDARSSRQYHLNHLRPATKIPEICANFPLVPYAACEVNV